MMMRMLCWLLLGGTLSVQADSLIEVESLVDGQRQQSQIAVDKGRVAILSEGKVQLVYEEKTGQILVISHEDKSYQTLDSEKMAAMAKGFGEMQRQALSMMESQMQGLSPEQRAQMQQMLGMGTRQPPPAITLSEDGVTGEVDGKRCHWLSQRQDGQLTMQACTVKLGDTALMEQDYRTLNGFIAKAHGMADALGADQMDMAFSQHLFSEDKVPLQVKEHREGQLQVHSIRISRGAMNEAWFTPPTGYQVNSGFF